MGKPLTLDTESKQHYISTEQDLLIIRLYSIARSYNSACDAIRYSMQHHKDFSESCGIALNSIMVFAIEVSMKYITATNGHTEACLKDSRHSLSDLFQKFGADNAEVIATTFGNAYQQKAGREVDVVEILKRHDGSFEQWRYLTDVKSLDKKSLDRLNKNFDYNFMKAWQIVLAEVIERIHVLRLGKADGGVMTWSGL